MFIIFCEKQNKMPCNFKAVILWSLMHNFWVCGVSSAGKDAFLSPDHIFLLGILITSFNSFYTFFLAGLPCSWGASPISGGLEGQPEVVTVARIPEVAEAGLPCLVLFGHILLPCWTAKQQNLSKVLQPTVLVGKVQGAHQGQEHPLSLLSCSQGVNSLAWRIISHLQSLL